MLLAQRNEQLQALRGIAAMCVTVGHCFTTFAIGRIEEPSFHLGFGNAALAVGQLVFQPNTAVIFFYVLSGLVLGESLRRRPGYKTFGVRRLWRLLPVMWISIGMALALRSLLPPYLLPGATRWLTDEIGRSLDGGQIATDLAGLSWHANPVLWSVQIELAMILLLPLLMIASERLSLQMNVVAGLSLAGPVGRLLGQHPALGKRGAVRLLFLRWTDPAASAPECQVSTFRLQWPDGDSRSLRTTCR